MQLLVVPTILRILLAECLAIVARQAAALAREVELMLESRREMVRKVYSPCSNLGKRKCNMLILDCLD